MPTNDYSLHSNHKIFPNDTHIKKHNAFSGDSSESYAVEKSYAESWSDNHINASKPTNEPIHNSHGYNLKEKKYNNTEYVPNGDYKEAKRDNHHSLESFHKSYSEEENNLNPDKYLQIPLIEPLKNKHTTTYIISSTQSYEEKTNEEISKHYLSKYYSFNRGSMYRNYKFLNNSRNGKNQKNNSDQVYKTEPLNTPITNFKSRYRSKLLLILLKNIILFYYN